MKNWLIKALIYDFNPSPYNYLNFKWHHFRFLKTDDTSFTASLYLDNLIREVENDLAKEKNVNKRSLTLALIKKVLESEQAKQELILLFEEKTAAPREEIKQFLKLVDGLIQKLPDEKEEVITKEEQSADFPVRTYVIATHIYLEIHNNELHYETLIRNTSALKEFITSKFKANRISGRIADMKSFSYKKILSGKNTGGAKGQLIPQIKQIASNPETFGGDVSAFARNILKEQS